MPLINGRYCANPAFGRAVEAARATEEEQPDASNEDGHWVTIDGRHVLLHDAQAGKEHIKHAKPEPLPESGQASIYADLFEGRKTASGATFHQNEYTAALLRRGRWHAVSLGTRVELTHGEKRVVDRKPQSARALDLSRAAASALMGQDINDDKDARRLGLVKLDKIRVVPANTPLGPVRP